MTERRRISRDKQTHKKLPPGPGRPKGSPNKTTRLLKDAILMAAELEGGTEGLVGYLRTMARKHPTTFGPLLGRLIPLQATLELTNHTTALLNQLKGIEHGTATSALGFYDRDPHGTGRVH